MEVIFCNGNSTLTPTLVLVIMFQFHTAKLASKIARPGTFRYGGDDVNVCLVPIVVPKPSAPLPVHTQTRFLLFQNVAPTYTQVTSLY